MLAFQSEKQYCFHQHPYVHSLLSNFEQAAALGLYWRSSKADIHVYFGGKELISSAQKPVLKPRINGLDKYSNYSAPLFQWQKSTLWGWFKEDSKKKWQHSAKKQALFNLGNAKFFFIESLYFTQNVPDLLIDPST